MDDIIDIYVQETFHPELQDVIKNAFLCMENFDLKDTESGFVNLLMTEDQHHPENLQDNFLNLLNEKLDIIVTAHGLTLDSSTALWEKLEILEGLYAIQNLNDYSNIITILESDMDDDEKFGEVLTQCCALSPTRISTLVLTIDPATLKQLEVFIQNKELNEGKTLTSFSNLQTKIIENIRQFRLFCAHEKLHEPMGIMLVEANVLIGQPLERYIPFVQDGLKGDDFKQLAIDVLSLLLLSDEGHNNPITAFKKYSGLLLDNLTAIGKVDVLLTSLCAAFETFKSHQSTVKESQ